jgi:HPt (histidine-containing phosphotransfer) domain-containing protein/GAF domain-containing protein
MGHPLTSPYADPPDLTTCERELVHVPGAIQPHGVLLVLDAHDAVCAVSANAAGLLGRAPGELVGRPLAKSGIVSLAESADGDDSAVAVLESGREVRAHLARSNALRIVELLPFDEARPAPAPRALRQVLGALHTASSIVELCRATAAQVRGLTSFDRVVVYRFRADGVGEVVAEASRDGIARYEGLRFPASDVPRQARALYTTCRLRVIPNAKYEAVPLVSASDHEPIDLTHALLRSVSPVHREFMRNMGVSASMGISIIVDGRLWGLVTCNHESGARHVSTELRSACAVIGEVVSTLVEQKERVRAAEESARSLSEEAALLRAVGEEKDLLRGLSRARKELLSLVRAEGCALVRDGEIARFGACPEGRQMDALVRALGAEPVAIDSLVSLLPSAREHREIACGMVAVPLPRRAPSPSSSVDWLLWFRPELTQVVVWGGDPRKVPDATGRIGPRTSFAKWQETVLLRSAPFDAGELQVATRFGRALSDVLFEIEARARIEAQANEIARRQRALQLVLDATGDGIVEVALDGRVLPGRSRAAEQWLGPSSERPIWELLLTEPAERESFEVFFQQIAAGVLPFVVAAAQLPSELRRGGRTFSVRYRAVRDGAKLTSVLVILEDVSERVAARQAAADAEESLAIFTAMVEDRASFTRSLRELERLLGEVTRDARSHEGMQALHTLKGSAGVLGLRALAQRCHELESMAGEGNVAELEVELARIRSKVEALSPPDPEQRSIVKGDALERALALAERGELDEVAEILRSWASSSVSTQLRRLERGARVAASARGASLDLVVNGDWSAVHRESAKLLGALGHVVMNAAIHGIEPESERVRVNKPARGTIVLRATRTPGGTSIEVTDDGRGFALAELRAAAVERGAPSCSEDALDAAFSAGVSTCETVSLHAGRGLGLGSVRSFCRALGGGVDVVTEEGKGARVVLRLPPATNGA